MIENRTPIYEHMHALESLLEWKIWIKELPFLSFPCGWKIQVIPPFLGAIIRFCISKDGLDETKGQYVSIYFDAYQILGLTKSPHWEIYPDQNGDATRFILGEETEMIREIDLSLEKMKAQP